PARRRGGPGPGLHRDDLRGSLLAGTDRARAGRLSPGHRPGSAGDVGAHPAPVPVSPRGSDARHGRIEPGRRRSGRARGPVPRARLVPPRAAATLRVLRFTDLSASGICILWITFRCGGRNAFGARIPTLSVPRPLRRFVVIHNCCVLCWLSGCLDKVVVSVGRRSPPLTTTEGRDLPRGSAK